MYRHPVRTFSSSPVAMDPRPFRVRQHDIEMFYALVGGKPARPATQEVDREEVTEEPAVAALGGTTNAALSQDLSSAPVSPVGHAPEPDPVVSPEPQSTAASESPADWAAALHSIAPAPRPVGPRRAKPSRRAQVSWSPKVLCKHLVSRADRLQGDSWMRKLSGDAMRRLGEAQVRLNAARPKHS